MSESPLGPLVIRLAGPTELDLVIEIYDEAAQWLHGQGFTYWPYPQPDWVRQTVAADIKHGRVFLCRIQTEGRAVGTFRLLGSDPGMWPGSANDAGYVHGLAIRPSLQGHGIGALMLEWVKQHLRAQGKRYLRLDCEASNRALRAYYERLGFVFRGESRQDRYQGARYELALAPKGQGEGEA